MTTIKERREVAAKLRKIDTSDDPLNSARLLMEIEKAIGTWRTTDDWPTPEWLTGRNRDTVERLADLIDPGEPSGHECVPGECPLNVRHDSDFIDRDALLELAGEMDMAYPDSRDVAVEYIDDYARRIREALGVEA